MTSLPTIFIVGETTVDLFLKCPPGTAVDQLKLLPDYVMLPGGAAVNMATSLSFLAAQVSLCGRVGADFAGQFVRQYLHDRDIHPASLVCDPMLRTALSIISIADSGELGILQCVGANRATCAEDIDWASLASAQFVQIAGAFTMNNLDGAPTAEVLRRAKTMGKITGLSVTRNTSRKDTLFPCLQYIDYLFLNRKEAVDISGCGDEQAAAQRLRNCGTANVAITLGSQGVYLSSRSGSVRVGSLPIRPVDTTGCGDAFVAGFLWAIGRGMDTPIAASWGNAVAAHCARTVGAVPVPFEASEIDQMLSMNAHFKGVAALVLAGGKSQRMQGGRQKLLLEVGGKPVISWVIDALRQAGVHRIVLLLGYRAADVRARLARSPVEFLECEEAQRGTGYAVKTALTHLPDLPATVLVVNGDTPLLTPTTVQRVVQHLHTTGSEAVVCTATSPNQIAYGHGAVVRDDQGLFRNITHATSSVAKAAPAEVNVGTYCFRQTALRESSQRLSPGQDGSFHFSDVLKALTEVARPISLLRCRDFKEFISVNTPKHLTEVETLIRTFDRSAKTRNKQPAQ